MAGTAGLPGLPRETWKRLRRRSKNDREQADRDGNQRTRGEQPAIAEASGTTTAITLHRALFRCLRHLALRAKSGPAYATTIVQEMEAQLRQ